MLVDIGLNLGSSRYDADREAVLALGREAGVGGFILTGSSVRESASVVALARRHGPDCWATAGVHPHNASSLDAAGLTRLRELLHAPEVVAVGETGLDFNRNFSPPAAQENAFATQIGLAGEYGLPLFLYYFDASARFTDMLHATREQWQTGVVHCFTGSREALHAYLDLGLMIGITGWVCDERRGQELQRLIKEIPADRLLLETDGPYLIPRDLPPPLRQLSKDKRNEPAFLPHIAARVAALRGETLEALAEQTTANARQLFQLPLVSS
jgi:TatD DNase family protein